MQARAGNNCISRHTPPDNGNNDDEKDDEEQLIIWSIIMNDDEYNNIFDNKYRRGSHLTAHKHTSVTHPQTGKTSKVLRLLSNSGGPQISIQQENHVKPKAVMKSENKVKPKKEGLKRKSTYVL